MKLKIILIIFIAHVTLSSLPSWMKDVNLDIDDSQFSLEANCIYLVNNEEIEIKNSEYVEITNKIAIKILNWDGVDYAKMSFNVGKKDKCSIKGWRYSNQKEWTSLSKKSIYDMSLSNYSFYYDEQISKIASFSELEPGNIVAFEISRKIQSWTANYQLFTFQNSQPVISTELEVSIPKDWLLQKSEQNLEGFSVHKSDDTYTWSANNLPFYNKEEYSLNWSYLSKNIKFVAINPEMPKYNFRNWDSISQWYWNESKKKCKKSYNITSKVNELIDQSEVTYDKCKKIADFVKTEIRYVAIEIDKNTYLPRDADKTLANGFGDCKDKTILMMAMLDEIGVKSYPVLVNVFSPVEEKLPTPFQFNHCIIAIPLKELKEVPAIQSENDLLYFDPTDKYSIFGNWVDHLHDESILICNEFPDVNLRKIPLQKPEYTKKKIITEGKIESNGLFSAKCKLVYFNNKISDANELIHTHNEDEMNKIFMSQFSDIIKNVIVSNYQHQSTIDSVVISYDIQGSGLVSKSADYYVFSPNIYHSKLTRYLSSPTRISPILYGSCYDITYSSKWKLPKDWISIDKHFTGFSEYDGGSIDLEMHCNDSTASFLERVVNKGKIIPPEKYDSVVRYEREKKQLTNYTMLITTSDEVKK